MVYIYEKRIGEKSYYYLRISSREGKRVIAKDIAYLGTNIGGIKKNLESIPKKYKEEIRKGYKNIHKFLESNRYLEKIKNKKIKYDKYFERNNQIEIEACKLHWEEEFNKLDKLTKKEYFDNFIIEFSYNTTSIEGNTISLKEARNLLAENITPKNKELREVYDLENSKTIFEYMKNENKEINHDFIIEIHSLLMKNIDNRLGYRTRDIKILGSRFDASPFQYVKIDMNLLLDWYNKNKKLHPLVLGTLFHHKFEKVHPFMDGNGRTGRMILNYILIKHKYPPLIIRRKRRSEYLKSLNKADKCSIKESDKDSYSDLIKFISEEMNDNYWNLFL